ncbi:MAG: chorismate mutase [Solirubrobacterales bacterium]
MGTTCTSLAEVRDNIDRLDDRIVELLAERGRYVEQAARFKATKAAVVDNDRIEDIVLKVRHLANEYGTSPDLIEHIYRAMINAYILHESQEWLKLHEGA